MRAGEMRVELSLVPYNCETCRQTRGIHRDGDSYTDSPLVGLRSFSSLRLVVSYSSEGAPTLSNGLSMSFSETLSGMRACFFLPSTAGASHV
jgi:hypothetical protein